MRIELSREQLMEFLDYNPETGKFTWKDRINARGYKIQGGKEAGWLEWQGYVQIEVFGVQYQAHRLAWLFVFDQIPPDEVDHINGTKDDNRIVNLRLATKSQNQHNRKKQKGSSKYKGVYLVGTYWQTGIQVNKKQIHIGSYKSEIEAARARRIYTRILHGEFARFS